MEVESKARVPDFREIRKKLLEMGASFGKEIVQKDSIFKRKGEEFKTQGPGDFILRIRKNSEGKSTLTIKVLTDRAGVWIEHETGIENPEETRRILLNAGFSEFLKTEKTRIPGRLGGFELCLDDVKGLGTFLEVALDSPDGKGAKKSLSEFFRKLGFSEKDIVHKGYVAMLSERKGVKFNGTG